MFTSCFHKVVHSHPQIIKAFFYFEHTINAMSGEKHTAIIGELQRIRGTTGVRPARA